MPADKTIDTVLLIISLGALTLGLGSMLLGWAARVWDNVVNRYAVRPDDDDDRTDRTNGRTNEGSPHDLLWRQFLLDRTRAALIGVMVDSDMTTTDIRNLLKGTAEVIGNEVDAARQHQGKATPGQYYTPIAGRPTAAGFVDDPDLRYQAPPGR